MRHRAVTGSDRVFNSRSPVLYGKARHLSQQVPTISQEFKDASSRILRQLANIYVARARAGMTDNYKPVLSVGGSPDERLARTPLPPLGLLPEAAARNKVEKQELSYLRCLKQVHKAVRPKLYFEIGVDTGASLALAECPAVGVDPAFVITNQQTTPCRLFREKSDDFFANTDRCKNVLGQGIDLAFLDGMHLAEFILRDFIKTERWMAKGGVILIDDVLPDQMEMLERDRRFNAWCGDVYKIVPILRRYRPDLEVSVFETFIGAYRKGLLVVSGIDPSNNTLETQYDQIAAEIADGTFDVGSITELETVINPRPIKDLTAAAGRRG